LAVTGGPDALNASTASQENGGRRHSYKRYQECVFDNVLASIIAPKVVKYLHFTLHFKSDAGPTIQGAL
jgi:hypothetical protein